MKDSSNQYALAALRERRAEISGEIALMEQRLRRLRESMVHVDATLRLFKPELEPSTIAPKRPYKRVKLFGAGKLNRMILDAMMRAGKPMTTTEIVAAIVEGLNFGPDAAQGMKNRVRANLVYLAKVRGSVVKEGDRETTIWALKK